MSCYLYYTLHCDSPPRNSNYTKKTENECECDDNCCSCDECDDNSPHGEYDDSCCSCDDCEHETYSYCYNTDDIPPFPAQSPIQREDNQQGGTSSSNTTSIDNNIPPNSDDDFSTSDFDTTTPSTSDPNADPNAGSTNVSNTPKSFDECLKSDCIALPSTGVCSGCDVIFQNTVQNFIKDPGDSALQDKVKQMCLKAEGLTDAQLVMAQSAAGFSDPDETLDCALLTSDPPITDDRTSKDVGGGKKICGTDQNINTWQGYCTTAVDDPINKERNNNIIEWINRVRHEDNPNSLPLTAHPALMKFAQEGLAKYLPSGYGATESGFGLKEGGEARWCYPAGVKPVQWWLGTSNISRYEEGVNGHEANQNKIAKGVTTKKNRSGAIVEEFYKRTDISDIGLATIDLPPAHNTSKKTMFKRCFVMGFRDKSIDCYYDADRKQAIEG